MRHPLPVLTVIFCGGLFCASLFVISFWWMYGACVLCAALCVVLKAREAAANVVLYCFVFCLGATLFLHSQLIPSNHIEKLRFLTSTSPLEVKGFVASDPEYESGRVSFLFEIGALQLDHEARVARGKILVSVRSAQGFHYGEELILVGGLQRPFRRSYVHRPFIMHVRRDSDVVRVGGNRGSPITRSALFLKHTFKEMLSRNLSLPTKAVVEAMVLGEKRDIPQPLYREMMKTGTVHILVVSGFNVGIVSVIILMFLKVMHLPRTVRVCAAIPCLVLYCLATGASNPVVRATVMAIVFLIAYLVRREPDIYNSLSIAALFIVIPDPQQLFDIGFQLSFASVIAIVFFYPRLKSFLRMSAVKSKVFAFFCDGFLVSLSAWLGTAGLIAYYCKNFSPITVFANMVIVPLATVITLCGFSLIAAGIAVPLLAHYCALTATLAVILLIKINGFLGALPSASFHWGP